MSDDVFRSEAPPVAAVAESGGAERALGGQSAEHTGEQRQFVDSTVFAPLDEPRQLSEIEEPPDALEAALSQPPLDATVSQPGESTAVPAELGSGPIEPALSEATEARARRIRKLSPELLVRAIEIREETVFIAAEIERVEVLLPGFDASASTVTGQTAGESSEPALARSTKESP